MIVIAFNGRKPRRADDFLHECSMTKYERTMDMSHLVEIVLETNDVYS